MSQAHALLNHIIRPVSLALGEPHLIHEEILLSAATLRGFDPFAEDRDEGLGVFGISLPFTDRCGMNTWHLNPTRQARCAASPVSGSFW